MDAWDTANEEAAHEAREIKANYKKRKTEPLDPAEQKLWDKLEPLISEASETLRIHKRIELANRLFDSQVYVEPCAECGKLSDQCRNVERDSYHEDRLCPDCFAYCLGCRDYYNIKQAKDHAKCV